MDEIWGGAWDSRAMAAAWDGAREEYLLRRGDDVAAVRYGNIAPDENALALLGQIRGQRVLDFGCGGGHNAVACAALGATVMGVDVSGEMIGAARALARRHGAEVEFVHTDSDFDRWQDLGRFELVLAVQVLQYCRDAAEVICALAALVEPGGRMIVAMDHPLRNCFLDTDEGELSPFPVREYGRSATLTWSFAPGVPMQMYHAPLGMWLAWIGEAGLSIDKVIEAAAPPEICDELWPEDSPLAPLRYVPHTLLIVVRKRDG